MIGACMTVLTIGHLGRHDERSGWRSTSSLAIDALVFLASAVLLFMSIRAGAARRAPRTRGPNCCSCSGWLRLVDRRRGTRLRDQLKRGADGAARQYVPG